MSSCASWLRRLWTAARRCDGFGFQMAALPPIAGAAGSGGHDGLVASAAEPGLLDVAPPGSEPGPEPEPEPELATTDEQVQPANKRKSLSELKSYQQDGSAAWEDKMLFSMAMDGTIHDHGAVPEELKILPDMSSSDDAEQRPLSILEDSSSLLKSQGGGGELAAVETPSKYLNTPTGETAKQRQFRRECTPLSCCCAIWH